MGDAWERLLEPWLHLNARGAGSSVWERARRTRKGTSTHRTGLAGLDSEKESQTAQYYFFPQFKHMVLNRQNGYTQHYSQRSLKHARQDQEQGVRHHCAKEPLSPEGTSIPMLAQNQALLVTMEGVEQHPPRADGLHCGQTPPGHMNSLATPQHHHLPTNRPPGEAQLLTPREETRHQ